MKKHSKRKIKLTTQIHGQKRAKTNKKRCDPSIQEGNIHGFGGETENVTDKNRYFFFFSLNNLFTYHYKVDMLR